MTIDIEIGKLKVNTFVEWTKVILTLIGFVFILISVWLNGWMILRFATFGVLLVIWGSGIKYQKEEENIVLR